MRLFKQCIAGAVGLCLLGGITLARAAGVQNVTFSGFLSAGASQANREVIPGSDSVLADGSVQSKWLMQYQSRFGLQVSANVNPDVSVTGQLLAVPRSVFGSGQDFSVYADWAYIKYRFSDKVAMRVGRIKLPSFLISDYYEVGYAYPWLRPPVEMYSANPMTGLNGIDFLIRQNFGDYGLLVQPFYGSNAQETTVPAAVMSYAPLCSTLGAPVGSPPAYPVSATTCPAGTIKTVPFSVSGLRGINLSLGSDIFTVRASWFKTRVYQSDFGVNGDQGGFSSAGFTMDWKNIVVYTEGFIRIVEGAANIAFPNQEGGYATIGYRFGKFLPHFTYGWIGDHNNPIPTLGPSGPTAGTPLKEKSMALGLRYELGRGAALKLDVTRLTPDQGTTGLLVADPNTGPQASDSIYIYGAGIDVVF